uniref:KfrA_N domain-containing protein n=1 Tax=Parastrongyloides trichosuri TaxID=131310 RepID=A0A0N4Z1N7_PARTI
MKSIPDKVEETIKRAIVSCDFPDSMIENTIQNYPNVDTNKVKEIAKDFLAKVSQHKFSLHTKIYEDQDIERRRKDFIKKSKNCEIQKTEPPEADDIFIASVHKALSHEVNRLREELETLRNLKN